MSRRPIGTNISTLESRKFRQIIGLRVICGYNSPLHIIDHCDINMLIQKTLLASLLTLVSVNVFAAGDYDEGKIKAYTCTGCHGIVDYNNTYPTYHVPRIGGQNKEYIVISLQAFKSGKRTHGSMNLQAEALSDQDIEDIAVYLAEHTNRGAE